MRILQGLLLSLGVHFLLVWGSQFLPPISVSNRERIEFDVVESPTSTSKKEQSKEKLQIVRQSLLPDKYKVTQSEDPLTFLSEESQRVKKQMRAAESGKTANRSPGQDSSAHGLENAERQKARKAAVKKSNLLRLEDDPDGDFLAKDRSREERFKEERQKSQAARQQNSLPRYLDLPQGYSTVGEALPRELEVGHFTALNTDRYLYYSFFARIEDLIRYEWESQVKTSILRTPRGTFQAQNTDQWISVIEVQIRPNGEFHRAILLKSSSIPGFDLAAIDSFAKAKLFPNPPREMVEDDGLIHLQYSFTVRYQPQGMVTR